MWVLIVGSSICPPPSGWRRRCREDLRRQVEGGARRRIALSRWLMACWSGRPRRWVTHLVDTYSPGTLTMVGASADGSPGSLMGRTIMVAVRGCHERVDSTADHVQGVLRRA